MTSPTLLKPVAVVALSIVRDGFLVPVVVTLSQALAAPPAPSSTQASLKKVPASRSAWVIVWLAVQLIDAPGARLATGVVGVHDRLVTWASVTSTLVSVTFPLLVATIVSLMTSPTLLKPVAVVALSSVMD